MYIVPDKVYLCCHRDEDISTYVKWINSGITIDEEMAKEWVEEDALSRAYFELPVIVRVHN